MHKTAHSPLVEEFLFINKQLDILKQFRFMIYKTPIFITYLKTILLLLDVINLKVIMTKIILFIVDFSSIIKKTKQEGLGKYNENRARSEHNDSLQNHSKQENKKLQPSSVEENETNKENNDRGMEGDEHETFAVSDIMDYIEAMSGTDYLGPQITFLDFAGQRMYYSYHQIYLSPGTFYILVVDMTKKLDETVEDPEIFEKGCTRFESWTYKGIQLSECL